MPLSKRGLLVLLAGACACTLFVGSDALAQANPFGGPRPPSPSGDGMAGWILAKQAEFYRGLSSTLRQAKADGSAVWTLLGLSFAYGVFHAVGPGHGKAVIASYLVANDETWRRGVALSFASALLQACVAVALVGIARLVLDATAAQMGQAVRVIEIASYALIAAVGAVLVWRKGRAFAGALSGMALAPSRLAVAGHPHGGDHLHTGGHHHPAHTHEHGSHAHFHAHPGAAAGTQAHAHRGAHQHTHEGDSCASCGHSHGPAPADLGGPGGWRRGLATIVGVGLRPCSGAIVVLVFSLAQGMFWAGVAATFAMGLGTAIAITAIALATIGARGMASRLVGARSGPGILALRGLELAAAVVLLAFGALLLSGYIASEKLLGA